MFRYKTNLNLDLTLSCGQCFRWTENAGVWRGIVKGIEAEIYRDGEFLVFENVSRETFERVFYDYFDFGRDYSAIEKIICEDENVQNSVEKYGNLRILRQDSFEALISFIISACNNIPRISSIVTKLCENFGENASFPTPETLAKLTESDLAVLHAGYRVPYIMDAAKKVYYGEIDFDELNQLDTDTVRKKLMTIYGVGRKVADCTMLFGMNRLEVFPVDRHIKRICAELYPDGLPECFRDYGGLAQQYLFVEQRTK